MLTTVKGQRTALAEMQCLVNAALCKAIRELVRQHPPTYVPCQLLVAVHPYTEHILFFISQTPTAALLG